jgi:hypothetical protein
MSGTPLSDLNSGSKGDFVAALSNIFEHPPWIAEQVASAPLRHREAAVTSGVDGFTFMKSTQSGWENYVKDAYTTIPPTAEPHGQIECTVGRG